MEAVPDLNISESEIRKFFDPCVVERFGPNDSRWLNLVEEYRKRQRLLRLRRQTLGLLFPKHRRSQKSIHHSYSLQWSETPLSEQLSRFNTPIPYSWRGDGMMVVPPGIKTVHQLFLNRAIAQLTPSKVLEVGFGNGLNLFLLGAQFPEVEFHGVELTKGGVVAALKVCASEELPPCVKQIMVGEPIDPRAHQRLKLQQSNAIDMPFADNTFDLVFTAAALEQMEEVRDQALREIARVAKKYVVMIEPFRDWNGSGLRRDYIVSMDYFSSSISDLNLYGLDPFFSTADIPCKITMSVGIVISKKRQR